MRCLERPSPPHAALFRNNHDGTFTDVTLKAGVANDRWGLGCAVGDYDNDGWPDLYVTNVGKNRLYHNNRNGTFTDVAEEAGVALGGDAGSMAVDHTGATFGDYDGDGRLDLFVAGYIRYDFNNPPLPGCEGVAKLECQYRGVNVMCGPRGSAGRRRPPVSQQRGRNLYRCQREGRRERSQRVLRTGRAFRGCERGWQAGSRRGRTTRRRTISTSTRATGRSTIRAT